jgi:methylmalonyl-CoA/ethylmalonyl-CoA epimerase
MIRKLDHIGIAVEALDDVRALYEDLGLREARREEVAGQGVRVAFLPVGETRIELLEPTSSDSPIAAFLRKRGAGIHHLCFAVDDLDAALESLARKGYRLIHRTPVPGADGRRVAFLHPEAGRGVLIELAEDGD